jgi:dienelactone hydrolase
LSQNEGNQPQTPPLPGQPPQQAQPVGTGQPNQPPQPGQPAGEVPLQQPVWHDTGVGVPSDERRIKPWMILLAAGVVLIVFGFIIIKSATGGVSYQRVTFTTEGLEPKPVTVSGLLVKPPGGVKGKVPGVVLAHGLTGSKEWYVQMSRQLAKEGFVVLSIDLRGHGGSSGACTFAYDEANDVTAAGGYLKKNVPEVDPAHITAMGHSLGGVAVTRAGIGQPPDEFSSVVAIWCWTGLKDAVTDLAGPLDAFVGRSWLFTTFSKTMDINSPEVMARYNMINAVDDAKPPNYMLAIGSADELTSVEREQQLMEKLTALARRTGPEPKLKENVTYGDFTAGTARRLVITNDDHVTELASGAIVQQAIDWIKQDAGLPVTAGRGAPFLWGRFLGIIVLALGIFAAVMALLSLTRKKLFPDGGEIAVTPPWDYPAGRQAMDVLIYALPVIAASFLAMPAAKALGVKPFVPYAGVNEFSIFYLTRTLLLLPFFVALVVVVARRAAASGRLQEQVKEGAGRWGRSVAYGLIPIAVIIFTMLVLGGPLILPRAFARLPLYFFLGVTLVGAAFWMEDYLFYKLAYRYLETGEGLKGQWRVLLVRAVVLDLALVAALLPLMKGLGVTIDLLVKAPLLLLLLLATPFLAVLAKVSMKLRSLTGGSLAFALMFTAITVWFFTGPIGTRGF